jgi:hypothetical protein
VEDGQLDLVASASWPRFALVQLAQPLQTPPNPDSVDWLLVTVKKREAKRAPSIDEPMPDLRSPDPLRPFSPSTAETSTSRFSTAFGFSSLANKFRRKSYFAELAAHSAPTRSRSLQPITYKQRPQSRHVTRSSGASDAPTEYTIGEMGEIVKIPSFTSSPPVSPTSPQTIQMDPVLSRSSPSDWVYLGEGGAHVVFRYRGSDRALQGRAMRLVKTEGAAADVALRNTWAAELLPQLVPADLLAAPTPANVDEKWTRAIVTPTELMRPAERRAEGKPLAESVDYARPAQLMDDLTCGLDGHKVVAVEIKPKWGFLPQAQHLTPPESIPIKSRNCRFCLHQHYRGESIEGTVYCPLDLYSGDSARIRKALDGLWAQWKSSDGDKNNLRIYIDGKMVLPSSVSPLVSSRCEADTRSRKRASRTRCPTFSSLFSRSRTRCSSSSSCRALSTRRTFRTSRGGSRPRTRAPSPSRPTLSPSLLPPSSLPSSRLTSTTRRLARAPLTRGPSASARSRSCSPRYSRTAR